MQEFIVAHQWVIYLVAIWTIPWKGVALWKAAKSDHRIWFIILLVLNTLAILDILFIFFFSKKKEESESQITTKNGPTILSNGKRIV